MAETKANTELPDICYDEPIPGHPPNPFPFILVKKGNKAPSVLFIDIRQETDEFEVGPDGAPQEIVDSLLHKYVNLELLKEKLPPHLNDMVREALGMKPLKQAQKSGQAILDKAIKAAEKNKAKEKKKKKP